MHIPDGYLGPQTYLSAFGIMVPLWTWASSRVKRTLSFRKAPVMALSAAFCFVLMMFNVPAPGGTSGHAVGAALVAILLGPWAALVAVSVTLAVQALLFGDGGITAYGANCLSMAAVMPFVGWWTYRLAAGHAGAGSKRRWLAAGVAGYVGINAAALSTAIMLGIQPALAHDASGRALYCPFALGVTLPAMALEHLFLFGPVEALATGLVVAYLSRAEPELLESGPSPARFGRARRFMKKAALGVSVLVLLTPAALYLAARAGGSEAWGEWGHARLQELAGYLPEGFSRLERLWHAPMPDYAPAGDGEKALPVLSSWYLASAALGVAVLAGLGMAARRWLARKETDGIAS